jgi:hypothetical protein
VGSAWARRHTDAFGLLLAATITAILALFSTRVPVYDGERLFLIVFPLWALLAGLGFETAWRRAARWRWARVALGGVLAAQAYGVVKLHPFELSYYNAFVDGLRGAERLGLELTYWGDTVDRPLLDALAHAARPGQSAAIVPTLHHIQPAACLTPELFTRQISLQDQAAFDRAAWLVVYRRTAYWPSGVAPWIKGHPPLMLHSRQGVWLSGIWPAPAQEKPRN